MATKTLEEMQQMISHLPESDPDLMETIYTEYVQKAYIIYDSKKNVAACTRCGETFDIGPGEFAGLHGQKIECPMCGETTVCLSAGRGRENRSEFFRILSFTEAQGEIWAFLNSCKAEFPEMGRPVIKRCMNEIYIISKDRQEHWKHEFPWCGPDYFRLVRSMNVPNPPGTIYGWSKYTDYTYTNGLIEMLQRSDCRYLATEELLNHTAYSIVPYLEVSMKYHSVELLAKAGFTRIAKQKVNGMGSRAINWRADSLEKILKLRTGEVKRLRKINPNIGELEAFKKLPEKYREQMPWELIKDCHSYNSKEPGKYIEAVEEYMPFDKWIRWAKTQDHYMNKSSAYGPYLLRDYKDYMRFGEKLGKDILKNCFLRPADLKKVHDELSEEYNEFRRKEAEKRQHEEEAKAAEAFRAFDQFGGFHQNGLVIIAAKCQEDLNKESAKLGHCVRTYGSRIGRGNCFIFFVRSEEKPDEPYYTLETKASGDFVQCRGAHNCDMTPEVKAFTDSFLKRLSKQIKKKEKELCQTA